MPDASAASVVLRHLAQGVHRYLAEWLRICSVYLGIAVIVTVSMGFALPGLRDQALQVHKALLTALAPSSIPPSASSDQDGLLPGDLDTDPGAAVALAVPDTTGSNATGYLTPMPHPPAPARARPEITANSAQVEALRNYISRKYKVAYDATGVLVNTSYRVGRELKVDPLLLLAVIAIESRYNPFAESSVGAQGLMQVMTSVHRSKFDTLGSKNGALDPVANIRVGAGILKDCIDRRGSVSGGLACYVGASGPNDGGYGDKVLAERRRLAVSSGIPLARD
ncbi:MULTISPECIES: lytic transglycosylase domain-containing protein [unclassified Achromobacter]|uniref:lytic transglycosylase domain-containing protein n=1 Tax=unclassified Achromobacter TaxID=2626865 RepID=UPI000B519AF2|nr:MULTISPECIES: lytic transglycosylase domain-containing protein [unclassified Achromobacter]OWT75338.1 lytic transglycosylase [Achromobacter sp. HZ28]OWT75998.1 lytic transglycosylase [Achromobacter sp. HZ34]